MRRSGEFAALVNGYPLCGQRLVRLKYEIGRAVAATVQQKETLKKILQQYLDEVSRLLSEKTRLGHETKRLSAIMKEGMADRYEGPLLFDRYRIFGTLAPAGKFYIVDYDDPDLISSGSEEVHRLDTLELAQQVVSSLHAQRTKGIIPMAPSKLKPRVNMTPSGKVQSAFLEGAEPAAATAAKAKASKPAKDVKAPVTATDAAPKEKKATAGNLFKDLIMAGKLTDDQIFVAVKKEFGLDDSKRGYVKWYRNDLKKKGQNPPDAVGGTEVKLPKAAGLGDTVDLDKAETPVVRTKGGPGKSTMESKLVEAARAEAKVSRASKKKAEA